MTARSFVLALVLGMGAVASFAQEEQNAPRIKEEGKIVFNPHWNIQLQGGAAYTVGEAGFGDLISPSAGLYAGYQFTPLWGLRFGATGWQAKGAWVAPASVYKYNFVQGNVDVTLDLGNLCCGYSHKRLFNPYIFAGVGVNGGFNNDEAVALDKAGYNLAYLWDGSHIDVAGRAGLGVNVRLADRVYFNLEANMNVLSDKFNSKKAGNPDWHFNAVAGFVIKLGKTHKRTEPVYYDEPAPVAPVEEKVETKTEVVEQKEVAEVKAEPLTRNVKFRINSARISAEQEAEIDAVAEYMAANPEAKVTVCGYADKETGNPAFNLQLSKKRAEAVAARLEGKGVDASRITVDYKGDTVQPYGTPEENRVTICVAAE